MWRVLLILSLVPQLAAILARGAWWVRVARRDSGEVRGSPVAEELAAELVQAEAPGIHVTRGAVMWRPTRCLALPGWAWGSKDAAALGVAVQSAGMVLLAARSPEVVAARLRVLRMGAAAPPFALVVGVFLLLVAKLGLPWVCASVIAVGGFAAVLHFATAPIELRAAAAGIAALRASRIAISSADLERVEACAKAAAWRQVVPLSLAWMAGYSQWRFTTRPMV
jgi:hypothetical protein